MGVSRHSLGWDIAAVPLVIIALWVVYFFRDPERTGDRGEHLVVSPADGLVVMVTDVEEPSFIAGMATRISIFMNVFDVHVNRYPVNGIVRYLQYNKGLFLHAAHEKASLDNEQMSVGIESGSRQHSRATDRRTDRAPHRELREGRRQGRTGRAHGHHPLRLARRCVHPARTARCGSRSGERTVAGTTVLAELGT